MDRERLINIGTTIWAIALVVTALLHVTGATPAFAFGDEDYDCEENCDLEDRCAEYGGCTFAGEQNEDSCVMYCRENNAKVTWHISCPAS